MSDFSHFERIFGTLSPFPYNRSSIQQAESARRSLDGALFIDRVLKALNLSEAASNYPPKNEDALRQLHQHISESSNITVHHKLSIFYYLLLDIDSRTGSHGTGKADKFAMRAGVPDKYQIFMKGLWYMDSLNFDVALEYLTHPSLTPDFTDDIITILVRHAQKTRDFTLPLAYYHTTQPNLRSSIALEALFKALAASSVTDAFEFSRAHADTMRKTLFQRLILYVLENPGVDTSADRAYELTSLSFDADEERWFQEYLESGAGKRSKLAKDTLLMRRIATGDAKMRGEKGTWAVILEAFKAGSGGRAVA
ncbi:nuclear pore complex assembly-domain-containing protein [Xylariomycetidae sp. FL2044]|nr:nuclear pore complex assembly-domain-containing protein [Xylariomycetidae sp. FL2044]